MIDRRLFMKGSVGAAAAVGLGAGMSASWSRGAVAQEKTITIGGSIPLSGRAAETGLNVHNGYETAIKYINEELGGVEIGGEKYKLDLQMVDDASDPARATTLIQRQLDDGVDFFLGSFGSNIVLPTAAIVDRAGKPMVQTGGGSDKIFTQGYKYVFGFYPRATRQFQSTAAFFGSLQPKPKTFSVISTNDAFSKTFAEGAKTDCTAQGLELLEEYELPAQVTDTSSVLSSVRANTPDVLVCTTHDQNSLLIARQMIASGTNVNLLYQALGPQLASYREALGNYANGITGATYWEPDADFKDKFFGDTKTFVDYYKKNYDRPLAYHTAGGAACIITYVTAMQNAGGTDPAKVRDALADIDIMTLYGPVKFTADGDADPIVMGAKVFQIEGGEPVIVFPEEVAMGKPSYPVKPWAERA